MPGEKKKRRKGDLTQEQRIEIGRVTEEFFPGFKSRDGAMEAGQVVFVRRYGIERLPELYRLVGESDFLNLRNGHTGLLKPALPTWIFPKNWQTKSYKFDKIMAGDYANDRMAGLLEKNAAPAVVSRPVEDYVTVALMDGSTKRVLRSLLSEDGKTRYRLRGVSNADGVPEAEDQGEAWTEADWLEEREAGYRRHPEWMPEGWAETAAEIRARLGLEKKL